MRATHVKKGSRLSDWLTDPLLRWVFNGQEKEQRFRCRTGYGVLELLEGGEASSSGVDLPGDPRMGDREMGLQFLQLGPPRCCCLGNHSGKKKRTKKKQNPCLLMFIWPGFGA